MAKPAPLRVFLVDDEALALARLRRLLRQTGRVEIAGEETDPVTALARLEHERVDALFLDIQMPGLNGFEMLSRMAWQPLVIFTTAYDEYALQAFEVHSIDYLLKPVEAAQLDRALGKLERLRVSPPSASVDLAPVLAELAASLREPRRGYPSRIASRRGDHIRFIDISRITHFYSQDKLTYAATLDECYVVDRSVGELEEELDPARFVRIHRAVLLNADFIDEIHAWFGGRLLVRLKDGKRTELTVARERVKALRERLGF